ncbi:zinc finger protein 800a isoform X1 [Scleropages formosus]|uniref:Zinc finger protein 800 n=2 Tax=Scleropages formosus TaxID=113540 RepID=A0A8C9RIX5_SCLFO|nr:zinc finger protein 800 isoform X1 [Scleropages formosus]XP_018603088.2 zinc finger protein 800 isoform X1 [Scleropages formosus]XP_018603089.2 zinc finger protein 800 isoform X1 [Scleropages formosus]XP_018603090.2 zinc finger protein 800 isoform X1 [Scleropages formosus]XP_018603091.2 zinc finger protein 800 isoform X1 [Scleropages formosus]XP_029105656.1 zinc finger protein 800 isoform X1 [Scleropages formosus]
MERPHSALRKSSHFVRKQVEELDTEAQRISTRDQCCQTEEHRHDNCRQEADAPPGSDRTPTPPAFAIEPGDPAVLQRPLQTSKSGIQQIIECFRSGTAQLKHILLKEVDTIFECKLCRSMFRSLPNLIAHKEFYCFPTRLRVHEPPPEDSQSQALKDLLAAIYPRKDGPEYVVRLEPIESNQNAVFQFLTTEEEQLPQEEPEAVPPSEPDVTDEDPAESLEAARPAEPAVQQDPPQEQQEDSAHEEPEAVPPKEREEQEVKREQEEEEQKEEEEEEEGAKSWMDDVTISCCLCGKDFNSRRGVRRHCRKMHKAKLEELRKFTDTRTVPISLLSMVKDRSSCPPPVPGRSCPVCQKTFATKANVRRHFDEVHRGLRRDYITPDIATKPGQPLSLEPPGAARLRKQKTKMEYNLSACTCLLCKRKYSSQMMLKRHLHIVHKIDTVENGTAAKRSTTSCAKAKGETWGSAKSEGKGVPAAAFPPSEEELKSMSKARLRKLKLSMGFDFKQLYCKLCKRQFTTRQNLTKHMDLHMDGSEIYIKFYRCPLCSYESRRKRDVLRHMSVVHKKSSRYLDKILPSLESRAVKKPVELVLNNPFRKGLQKDVDGQQDPPAGPSSAQQSDPTGGPITRQQDAPETGGSVLKVSNNFVLHTCDVCGRAFGKKVYLESHRRTHKTTGTLKPPEESRKKGRSTRSKLFLW